MSSKRILIADDEATIIRVLRLALETAGYEVESAANGEAALACILERQPDVLITDIEMPRMDGEELCRRIQRELPVRRFPIFVVTSLTALEHRRWSRDIGNLEFLEKPISSRALLTRLRRYFAECDSGLEAFI